MKAITIHQPWASLIAAGVKKSETRSWSPPQSLIGETIAIHAGRKPVAKRDVQLLSGIAERLPWYKPEEGITLSIPHGAVVATAKLLTAFRVGYHVENESLGGTFINCDLGHPGLCPGILHTVMLDKYGDYSVGRWIWVLGQIKALDESVAALGHQGFWNWEAPNGG